MSDQQLSIHIYKPLALYTHMKKNVLWVKNKSILFAKILNIIYNNRTLIGGINMDTINLITNLYNEYKMFGISEKCFYETVREVTSNQDKENVLLFTREFEEKIREKLNKRIEKTNKKESSCDSYSVYFSH